MFYVKQIFYDYDDRWSHVVGEFDNEQDAEDEADRLRKDNIFADISFEVVGE